MKSNSSGPKGKSAFLFAWNPENWGINKIEKCIHELNESGYVTERWTCLNQSATIGDRAFLMKVGSPPRGIMGSGTIVSKGEKIPHWNGSNKIVNSVFIQFDTILHPAQEKFLPAETLREDRFAAQWWRVQSSGIAINLEVLPDLEKLWQQYSKKSYPIKEFPIKNEIVPDTYSEGLMKRTLVTRYERDEFARKKCLEIHGYDCSVCNMNFEKTYGKLGHEFIHVHHVEPISTRGGSYFLDPTKDLIPVCPNCHSMIHRHTPPLTVEALKNKLMDQS